MINAIYILGEPIISNRLFRACVTLVYFLQVCPLSNTGIVSPLDKSDMILRSAFFLLSPHTPDKSSDKRSTTQAKSFNMYDRNQDAYKDHEKPVTAASQYFHLNSDSEELLKYFEAPMEFATKNFTLVTAQIGSTAHIPCQIHHIGECVVSWIRRKDYHLLTVGLTTYSSDDRYSATHLQNSEDWTLQIKFVQDRDAGLYECQVSTHPPTSLFMELKVVEPKAEIVGPRVKYLTPDSTLKLICRIVQATEAAAFIFWYHNNRMINYDLHRGINVSSEADFLFSELTINQATTEHSGNYTCVPSYSHPASVVVHIFNGDNPAAMYHEDRNTTQTCHQMYKWVLHFEAIILFLLLRTNVRVFPYLM
ncbi:zwei Ig domain protein zig-8-like isoform X1 [Anopheles aquasalis]|uniref:zwei Ig domain protein zig-8-like isoform X1 n=1 Tax=Anopheles aquasalis TaxID=42839 RepID=UPI00215B4F1C|nr:zwei Ig domain protein zig-8-like isoform X1 [Anopheles aquasalis]XP_050092913.1 zwei Ig domain protein zig-8-like isoform X1 [Anopheles aquasalis]